MFVNKSSLLIIVCWGGLIDHNISVILRYFLITSRVRLAVFADQTELSAILPIVKSCNVKPPVADPSCNVKTAATESYPR